MGTARREHQTGCLDRCLEEGNRISTQIAPLDSGAWGPAGFQAESKRGGTRRLL